MFEPNGGVQMEKTIGLVQGTNVTIGSMIGSGICVSTAGILAGVKSVGASLILWVACGLFSLLSTYCYAEMGTLIHRPGADSDKSHA